MGLFDKKKKGGCCDMEIIEETEDDAVAEEIEVSEDTNDEK